MAWDLARQEALSTFAPGAGVRKIKLEGNLDKIMKNVKAAQELVRSATYVETEY